MKLTEIKIVGYKSIDTLTFPIKKYGASYTTILLGKNETGKSNILDAFSLLAKMNNGIKVDFSSVKKQVDPEPQTVSVFYSLETEDDSYRDFISSRITISDSILKLVKVVRVTEEVWLQDGNDQYSREWNIELKPNTLKDIYYAQTPSSNQPSNEGPVYSIKCKKDLTEDEAEQYSELNWEDFIKIIQPILEDYFDAHEVPVSVWRAKDSDLVQDNISLRDFSKEPYKYPALKNMFVLAGFNGKEQIQSKIQEIEKSSKLLRKLEKKLSEESTKYINSKWKEHKVRIDVKISDELNAHITVQDYDNADCYYDMQDRSEGFKQFVSLLLSLSVKNQSGSIKNNLILIDEPEVHLHPSGIRYMCEELLKIGKNNYIFLATHSNFMIDVSTKERHFLVTKKRGITYAKQITLDSDLYDDEVLQTAFGIDTIRDFLSPYKVLVEGASDKILLKKALEQCNCSLDIRIANGNGSNIISAATKLSFDDIYPVVIVDDDQAGQAFKENIINIKDSFNESNVYTIRDLIGSLKNGSTIEDTLPIEYLESKTNEVLQNSDNNIPKLTVVDNKTFGEQLLKHLQTEISKDKTLTDKQKKDKINRVIDEIKTNISNSYDEKNIKARAPILYELAEMIIKILKNQSTILK